MSIRMRRCTASAVGDVGQRAALDYRHRIFEISAARIARERQLAVGLDAARHHFVNASAQGRRPLLPVLLRGPLFRTLFGVIVIRAVRLIGARDFFPAGILDGPFPSGRPRRMRLTGLFGRRLSLLARFVEKLRLNRLILGGFAFLRPDFPPVFAPAGASGASFTSSS